MVASRERENTDEETKPPLFVFVVGCVCAMTTTVILSKMI
jgi:hypothetical protein